jgi:hypothetical protein
MVLFLNPYKHPTSVGKYILYAPYVSIHAPARGATTHISSRPRSLTRFNPRVFGEHGQLAVELSPDSGSSPRGEMGRLVQREIILDITWDK